MKSETTIAISTQDHLYAALLFDRVLPLHSADSVPATIRYDGAATVEAAMNNIDIVALARFAQLYKMRLNGTKPPDPVAVDDWFRHQGDYEFTADMFLEFQNMLAFRYQKELAKVGVNSVPMFNSEASYKGATLSVPGEKQAFEITLVQVPVIDTSNLTWDQVLDVRSDKDFTRKARRFRLFFAENYTGKTAAYIRDSLAERVDEYEEACKRHGVKLVLSTISELLESKSLLGSLGLATAAILTGNPIVASTAALAGAAIELGKVVVRFADQKLDIDTKEVGEVALLVDIKTKTS